VVQRRLGRGLDFLISGEAGGPSPDEIRHLALDEIRANPYQPRREFVEEEIAELAASILEHGILQPVVVRATAEGYELVAGERRFRASEQLGRDTIPAIVRTATDEQMLELALIENIQREDLNPIDTAVAIRSLIDRLGLTQDEAARRLGKSRSAVANTLRLLDLPDDLQSRVASGALSNGHARALLAMADAETQRALAARVEKEGLSVRATEAAAKRGARKKKAAPAVDPSLAPYLHDLEDQLRAALGTRVSIQARGERGRIVIEYFSRDDFEGLLDRLLAEDVG
jgi:ParB family chromosome partitioning protein